MIVDKSRKICTKISEKAIIMVLFVGCLVLPIIAATGVVYTAKAMVAASVDGTVIFARFSDDESGLYIMDGNGKNQRILFKGSSMYPAWSPDGKKIAFMSRAADVGQISVLDVAEKSVTIVASGPGDKEKGDPWTPAWSPDSKKIAFCRSFKINDDSWGWDIWIVDANGKNEERLATGGYSPSWSPDGSKIAFGDASNGICVIDMDGKNRKKIYQGQCSENHPSWSPDGSRIVFDFWDDSDNEICVINSDGSDLERLTNNQADDHQPVWSPDGSKIAFCSDRDGNYEIYVMNSDGSDPVNLTNDPVTDWSPFWTAFSYAVEPAGKLKTTWGKMKAWLRPQ